MTKPSGLRHSSRQRSRSGLNCHRPADGERGADDQLGMRGQPRQRVDGGMDAAIRDPRREPEARPRRQVADEQQQRRAAAAAAAGRRAPPNVTTSGTLDGSIIATIISTQPSEKSDRLDAQRRRRRRRGGGSAP